MSGPRNQTTHLDPAKEKNGRKTSFQSCSIEVGNLGKNGKKAAIKQRDIKKDGRKRSDALKKLARLERFELPTLGTGIQKSAYLFS